LRSDRFGKVIKTVIVFDVPRYFSTRAESFFTNSETPACQPPWLSACPASNRAVNQTGATMTFTKKAALLTAAATFCATAGHAQSNPTVGGAPMLAEQTIVQNASNSPIHTTLVAAVVEAGLVETLSGPGPFTVFAPTDAAFADLPAGSVEALLEPQNADRLAQILTCHVVAAEAFSTDIMGMIAADGGSHAVTTVGGCVFNVSSSGGQIMIEDEQGRMATVTIADVDQSNGVIHVIDTVLLPTG